LNLITVVGAGPIGLSTAIGLKEEGWETTVIEEHPEIGKPVNCAGLISKSGVEENRIKLNGEVIVNKINGAKIFSPNKTILKLEKKNVALVIDREKFDKRLYSEAKKKGVEILTETKLIDVRNETLFIQYRQRGEMLKSKILIGADGVNSRVRHLMNLEVKPQNFVYSFQVRGRGSFEDKFVEMHFGDHSKGFFAWVIPESKEIARIGVGVEHGMNSRHSLQEFLREREIEVIEESASMIPIGKPIKEIVKENMMLVGDAAFQTKATSGGGIITGSIAAKAAAKSISNHLKHKVPLTDYLKELNPLNRELELHWKIRKYFNSLNEGQLNKLFLKLKNAGIEEFLEEHGDMDVPSKFLNKMLFSPKKWSLLPMGLRIMMK